MTSSRKIKANRANSQRSTGPKTIAGKSRAAQNALRHGLSIPVLINSALSRETEALAHEIAGEERDRKVLEGARLVAEAQIDLERIRRFRHNFLVQYLGYLKAVGAPEEHCDFSIIGQSRQQRSK